MGPAGQCQPHFGEQGGLCLKAGAGGGGWGKSREGHTDLPTLLRKQCGVGGVLSSARAISPNAKHPGSDVWSGCGRKRNQGLDLQPPTLFFPLLFQLQPWPHPPLSPHHQDHIFPPDSGSWPDGPQDWKKPRWKGGRVRLSGVRTPQNKYLPFCSSIVTSAFVSAASPQRSLPLFPLLLPEEPLEAASDYQLALWTLGVWLFSQILWKKEAPAVCGPDLNSHVNLTAGDYWIIL